MKNTINKTCFLCNVSLTKDNKTNEHIIKNSIGGHKKAKEFICSKCNNKTGHNWDKDIDTYIGEYCALLFDIKRQNGKIASKNINDNHTNKKYQWSSHNITQITPEYSFDGKNLKIMAKDKKAAENFFQRLQSEGKIPKNKEYIHEKTVKEISDDPVQTSLGFEIPGWKSNFSKSIVKSALALLSTYNYKALESCKLAKDFLKKPTQPIIELYYKNDPIINRPLATPLHTVHIFNEGQNIFGYVELFGFVRYKIHLSNIYDKTEKLNIQYSINPTTGSELSLEYDFSHENAIVELHPAIIQKSLMEEIRFSQEIEVSFLKCIQKISDYSQNRDILTVLKNNLHECYKEVYFNKNTKFINFANQQYTILLEDFLKQLSS